MKCDRCSKETIRTHRVKGGEWICDNCYSPVQEQMAPITRGTEPFLLKDGPIYSLPDNFPGKSKDGNSVLVRNSSEYRSALKEMNVHQGEPGEKVGGGRSSHTFEGKQKPKRKIYSF